MNSKQAKELDLVEFIRRLGHEPTSVRGSDVWFRSPFRPDERTPSFKVDARKNIWFDHGLGQGGTIIDLVEHYHRTADISSALKVIDRVSGGGVVGASPVAIGNREEIPKEKPIIERVDAIHDPTIEAYIRSRAIPIDLARLYLQEIDYRVGDHSYRALAFQNDSNGYEVRSPQWKGSLGVKDLTTLTKGERSDFALFEGSFDFLSTLAFYGLERPESNVIVLNSVGLVDRAKLILEARGARELFAYLDHDSAGRETLARLEGQGTYRVRDSSGFYEGFKDANEFLKQRGRVP